MTRKELTFAPTAWETITLAAIAATADMTVVDVAHAGWPLGLFADGDGNAW